jgi:hypothetical protein
MPIYTYKNQLTDEYKDVFQSMNDKHEYFGESGDEDNWVRIFYSPNASIDTSIDPFSCKDFNNRTESKKGTVGDMLDYSKEMSQRRADLAGGKDPVKEKYFENYSKERKGAKHPEQIKTFESKNVKVDYT